MDPLPLGRCTSKTPLKQCHRWANLICSHCNQGVCLEHYEIHQNELQTRLDRLSNRINDLRQTLHTLTHEQMIKNAQEKIDQWSKRCKNEIDLKHATMSAQLSKEIKQLNIDQFRSIELKKIDQDIGQPLIDLLQQPKHFQMKYLEILEQQVEQLKTMNSFVQITDEG
jgi:hypothetical protein